MEYHKLCQIMEVLKNRRTEKTSPTGRIKIEISENIFGTLCETVNIHSYAKFDVN